jgi:hypothetical protein
MQVYGCSSSGRFKPRKMSLLSLFRTLSGKFQSHSERDMEHESKHLHCHVKPDNSVHNPHSHSLFIPSIKYIDTGTSSQNTS